MLNNTEIVIKKIGGIEYAYITTSEGGDKIYCNSLIKKQSAKMYEITVASKKFGFRDPISVKFSKILPEELRLLKECGININDKTVNQVSKFLIDNEKYIPTISDVEELSLKEVLKYLKEYCSNSDGSMDEFVCIVCEDFREFAKEIGITQSCFKSKLLTHKILKPDPCDKFRHQTARVNKDTGEKTYIKTYRIDTEELKNVLKDMEEAE